MLADFPSALTRRGRIWRLMGEEESSSRVESKVRKCPEMPCKSCKNRTHRAASFKGPDLIGKRALNFSKVTVNLLASILIHRGTHRPDHAEHKCHLYHDGIVFSISWVHLGREEKRFRRPEWWTCLRILIFIPQDTGSTPVRERRICFSSLPRRLRTYLLSWFHVGNHMAVFQMSFMFIYMDFHLHVLLTDFR